MSIDIRDMLIDELRAEKAVLLDTLRLLVDRDLRFSSGWLDTGLITRDDVLTARAAIAKATGAEQ